MAYTVTIDERIEKEITKYLDVDKNNDIKSLLIAYLKLSQDYMQLQSDVEDAISKLPGS